MRRQMRGAVKVAKNPTSTRRESHCPNAKDGVSPIHTQKERGMGRNRQVGKQARTHTHTHTYTHTHTHTRTHT